MLHGNSFNSDTIVLESDRSRVPRFALVHSLDVIRYLLQEHISSMESLSVARMYASPTDLAYIYLHVNVAEFPNMMLRKTKTIWPLRTIHASLG